MGACARGILRIGEINAKCGMDTSVGGIHECPAHPRIADFEKSKRLSILRICEGEGKTARDPALRRVPRSTALRLCRIFAQDDTGGADAPKRLPPGGSWRRRRLRESASVKSYRRCTQTQFLLDLSANLLQTPAAPASSRRKPWKRTPHSALLFGER